MMTYGSRISLFTAGSALLLSLFGCSGGSDLGLSSGSGGNTGSTSDTTTTTGAGMTTTSGSGGASGAGGASSTSSGSGGSGGSDIPAEKFSFFVTSLKALQELSGSQEGFGGDLRYGETGMGAGLRGADKICATIAEKSMPGAGKKQWRAFLSAVQGDDGKQVNAIDRIGDGPWYDRLGRVFANTKADLFFDRPQGIDPAIKDDFPNEDGVPNHQPDPNQGQVDNHDFLTGSNTQGQLYGGNATCNSWTSNKGDLVNEGKPRVGHSWPRYMGGGPGGNDPANWMSALTESGCAPGVNLIEMGGPIPGEVTVGSGGGYGGFYCFALTP